MTKLTLKTLATITKKPSADELDRVSLVENISLTNTIHDLLNELNQYGAMVNECSKKKYLLVKQLQNEIDHIHELGKIPVLSEYFQLLFNLESCQQRIEQHELDISDIVTEMCMTKHIIINMVQIDQQTRLLANSKQNSSSTSSLVLLNWKKNMVKKINNQTKRRNSIIDDDDDDESNNIIAKSNGSSKILKNLFKFLRNSPKTYNKNHRNCSIRSIHKSSLIDDDDDNNTAFNDPTFETIERLKMKLKFLSKHRQSNEQCFRQLIQDCLSLKQELKQYYQQHYKELTENQQNLNQYFRYRLRTNELQSQIVTMDQSINDYRQQYRNTMDRIQTLSNTIHKNRNNKDGYICDIQS
ncbi:hypothetical protein DERF_012096 [Dermatophagoides farinae]|uniref:Uncharacterized protein n=1 Tax=Dermatophagoides farinae TaxID=6954 RepID=A0A922HPC2_DERFA|nr:hypothetical protein DERF_012096 [Dermatophagoides farinae]